METVQERKKPTSSSNEKRRSSFFAPIPVQAKLMVNIPEDQYEQEADRVSDQVVSNLFQASSPPDLATANSTTRNDPTSLHPSEVSNHVNISKPSASTFSPVQTKCDSCEAEEKENPKEEEIQRRPESQVSLQANAGEDEEESTLMAKHGSSSQPIVSDKTASQLYSSKGSGDPLPKNTKSEMEKGFGVDFSNVRIHTNPGAETMSKNLGAQAFTHGSDIYFNSGKFDPSSQSGKKLLAHELTHVVQQNGFVTLPEGFEALPAKIVHRNAREFIQRDLLDVVQELGSTNSDLTNWVFELGTSYEFLLGQSGSLTSTGRRRVRAVETAFNNMQEQNYSERSLVRWMQAIFATLGSLTARNPWVSDEQHERILEASRSVQRAARLNISSLRNAADQLSNESRQRQHRRDVARLTGRLRSYIRRNWMRIRSAPRFQWLAIERIMRRTLIDDNDFSAYVADLSETNPRLHQFLSLLQRNPDSIQRNQNDIFRAMVLAVGGEWADLVEQTDDQRLAGELTGDTETSVEAELAGTAIDTAITTIPILDQIGDVRDFSAHIYAILNISGRHSDEASSPMRWLGVVLSGIGAIPVIGSLMKGTGRIIVRILRRLGNGISGIVSRAIEPVIGLVRRNLPDAIPLFQRMLNRASDGWGSVVNTVTRKWSEVADTVSSRLDNVLLQATEFGTRMRGRWLRIRSTAGEKITEALATLQRLFAPVYRGVLAALRRGGRAAVRLIPPSLLNRANQMLERIGSLLIIARQRITQLRQRISRTANNLVDRFSTPTMRLERLNRDMERLDNVQSRLQRALDIGDSEAAELLYQEAQDVTVSIERRLGRSAGAEVADEAESVSETVSHSNSVTQTAETVGGVTEDSTILPPPSHVPRELDDTIPVETAPLQHEESTSFGQNNQHTINETNTDISEAPSREPTRSERIQSEQEQLQELVGEEQAIRPVDDPEFLESGYELEIELGDGVIYRRRNDGVWCRFNSPSDCHVPVPASLEQQVIGHTGISGLILDVPVSDNDASRLNHLLEIMNESDINFNQLGFNNVSGLIVFLNSSQPLSGGIDQLYRRLLNVPELPTLARTNIPNLVPEGTRDVGGTTRPRTRRTSHEEALGEAMEARGIQILPGHARHHMIPKLGGGALGDHLRDVMHTAGIRIDDGVIGVPLPQSTLSEYTTLGGATRHGTLHTNRYFAELLNRLRQVDATDSQVVEGVLIDAAIDLYEGQFVYSSTTPAELRRLYPELVDLFEDLF